MTTVSRRRFLTASASACCMAAAPSLFPATRAAAATHVTLAAATRVVEINGRPATVYGLAQPDGTQGLLMEAGQRLRVQLENRLGEDTVIHWHGLTPPWRQDGVGGLSQEPIPAGKSHEYDFLVATPGTNWMHSHFGLQEQLLLSAPLIVRDPAQAGEDVQELVVLFHDFTFRDPGEILAELQHGGHGTAPTAGGHAGHGAAAKAASNGTHGGHGSAATASPQGAGMAHLQDVDYDALLANDRTLDDPATYRVEKGGRVRLRLINGAASTNMWIDLGRLSGQLVSVDGMPVQPIAVHASSSPWPSGSTSSSTCLLATTPGQSLQSRKAGGAARDSCCSRHRRKSGNWNPRPARHTRPSGSTWNSGFVRRSRLRTGP